jgi:hypothetical protein
MEIREQNEPLLAVREYDDAVAAVDALADARFPVEHVRIVGSGIRTVEQVTGRFGAANALGVGALNGGLIGLFFGLLFDWWGAVNAEVGWGWLALAGLVYGAVVGAAISLALHGLTRGRDFASARTLDADRYEVILDGGDPALARQLLRDGGLQ